MRIIPKIERHGDAGIYMVLAGGDYEASLLAVDSLWNHERFDVDGDIVVAIPNRDVLLITGSNNTAGIDKLRETALKSRETGSYPLTSELFVFRNGKFDVFNSDQP